MDFIQKQHCFKLVRIHEYKANVVHCHQRLEVKRKLANTRAMRNAVLSVFALGWPWEEELACGGKFVSNHIFLKIRFFCGYEGCVCVGVGAPSASHQGRTKFVRPYYRPPTRTPRFFAGWWEVEEIEALQQYLRPWTSCVCRRQHTRTCRSTWAPMLWHRDLRPPRQSSNPNV